MIWCQSNLVMNDSLHPNLAKKHSSTSICSPTNRGDLYSAFQMLSRSEYHGFSPQFLVRIFEVTFVEMYHNLWLKNTSDMPLSLSCRSMFFILICAGFEIKMASRKWGPVFSLAKPAISSNFPTREFPEKKHQQPKHHHPYQNLYKACTPDTTCHTFRLQSCSFNHFLASWIKAIFGRHVNLRKSPDL